MRPFEPVNGYIFVEPEETEQEDIFIPKPETKAGIGVVKKAGTPYLSLLDNTPRGILHPLEGQRIIYKTTAATVEYKYHQQLNEGGRPLIRVRAHEVLAIAERNK